MATAARIRTNTDSFLNRHGTSFGDFLLGCVAGVKKVSIADWHVHQTVRLGTRRREQGEMNHSKPGAANHNSNNVFFGTC